MLKNEWLRKEINELNNEIKNKKKDDYSDDIQFILFMIFLIPLLLTAIYGNANTISQESNKFCEDELTTCGVWWRCKVCRNSNYSEYADWQGNYYCNVCGTKMGDE